MSVMRSEWLKSVPSPKSQFHEVTGPVLLSVNDTLNGAALFVCFATNAAVTGVLSPIPGSEEVSVDVVGTPVDIVGIPVDVVGI